MTVGMYGGKFMPLHKGHKYCLEVAAAECDLVYFILFVDGDQEQRILAQPHEDYLEIPARMSQVLRVAEEFSNVKPRIISVKNCRDEFGNEDWDKETPLVRGVCGPQIDYVYGSEPEYAPYFKKAYPESCYRLVDVDRALLPISGTKCRDMSEEERKKWLV